MRSSRIATLILSILTFAFSTQAKENQPTEQTISVPDGASRHFIDLQEEVNKIVLQDLMKGERYKIFLSSEQADGCLPFYIFPEVETSLVLEFEAEASETLIQLGKTCSTDLEIRFSIACTSCHSKI